MEFWQDTKHGSYNSAYSSWGHINCLEENFELQWELVWIQLIAYKRLQPSFWWEWLLEILGKGWIYQKSLESNTSYLVTWVFQKKSQSIHTLQSYSLNSLVSSVTVKSFESFLSLFQCEIYRWFASSKPNSLSLLENEQQTPQQETTVVLHISIYISI